LAREGLFAAGTAARIETAHGGYHLAVRAPGI
jgi:hypothetical protein